MHYINILYKGYTLTVAIVYIPILIANHSIVQSNLNNIILRTLAKEPANVAG